MQKIKLPERRDDLLAEALAHWHAMAAFRRDRLRCKHYVYGRQWDDTVEVDGRVMTESEYIRSQGNIPLKNNLIRRIVRNVVGVFRNQYAPPSAESLGLDAAGPDASRLYALERGSRLNMLEELHARTMEEFLISGLAVYRKWPGDTPAGAGAPGFFCRTDYVQPDYFIIDADMRDFRGWDASLVGEIHDVDYRELVAALARSEQDCAMLAAVYADARSSAPSPLSDFGSERGESLSPSAGRPGRCRVIELWRRESRGRYRCHDTASGELYRIAPEDLAKLVTAENRRRLERVRRDGLPDSEARLIRATWVPEQVWRYYFLSPSGHLLRQGDSPCPSAGHPYVFKAYPFIDGEIHSFVADLIDQQRYVNRLVTLSDWVIRASAKGVLLFPEDALPDGVDIDEISSEWSRFNGVILFRPKPGMPLPQQVSGSSANLGITELLQVQLKMMEDVSGVNGALQGKLDSGAVSGTLYDQQTRHALTGLLDILQSFGTFIREGFRKELAILADLKAS